MYAVTDTIELLQHVVADGQLDSRFEERVNEIRMYPDGIYQRARPPTPTLIPPGARKVSPRRGSRPPRV